jgi:hypothetical protein
MRHSRWDTVRRCVRAVACAAVLAAAGGGRAVAAPPAVDVNALKIVPAAPVQGDTLVVRVAAPTDARVAVTFDGSAVPAYAIGGAWRALVGTDPDTPLGTHEVRASVALPEGEPARLAHTVRLVSGHFGVRRLTLPPQTIGLVTSANLTTEARILGPVLARRTATAWWNEPFARPSASPIDSPYGEQSFYNGHREWWHAGVDFDAPAGSPVLAASAGLVALARALPLGGNTVIIDHGQGVLTEYLHLSAFTVQEGQRIERGAEVGRIGATGLVTGPSLHWGLYVNGLPVNPLPWLAPRPGLTAP